MFLIQLLLAPILWSGCFPDTQPVPDNPNTSKPRVIVTTDPELDDSNSLVRYLLYTTDFQTEGLIYASSQYHWKGDGMGTTHKVEGREYTRFGLDLCPCESWRWAEGERFIDEAVEIYAEVYENLIVHNPAYPTPDELKAKIFVGNVAFDGDISQDSPGSDHIKVLLLDDNPAPLYLQAWGGMSTIARALKSIQDEFEQTDQWPAISEKVSEKAILYSFADQDDTYKDYIAPNWPDIEWRDMANQTYGYGARGTVLPEDQVYLTASWTKQNISNQGPFGAFYRVWGDGKQMVPDDIFDFFGYADVSEEELRSRGYIVWMSPEEPGSWISEGDTPAFLNLIQNGLRGHEQATYGGWGGRLGEDVDPNGESSDYERARFFRASQHDFATRLTWTVTSAYNEVNHEPIVLIDGAMDMEAGPGESISVSALASDPDGDEVSVRWWQYEEAGTYPGNTLLSDPTSLTTSLQIPADAVSDQTIHLILEATDNGSPSLTRYQRVVITVR